jgi:hypothetical protein
MTTCNKELIFTSRETVTENTPHGPYTKVVTATVTAWNYPKHTKYAVQVRWNGRIVRSWIGPKLPAWAGAWRAAAIEHLGVAV